MLNYYPQSTTQVQECLPNALNLKSYALKHFPAPTPVSQKSLVVEVGRGLGKWLRSFHDWAATQSTLQELATSNTGMQDIKLTYNYTLLLSRVKALPEILSSAKPVFEAVLAMAQAELEDETQLTAIHGDFWTGKQVRIEVANANGSGR